VECRWQTQTDGRDFEVLDRLRFFADSLDDLRSDRFRRFPFFPSCTDSLQSLTSSQKTPKHDAIHISCIGLESDLDAPHETGASRCEQESVDEFRVVRRRLVAMKARFKVDFVIEERASDSEEEMVDEAQRGEIRVLLRRG